MSNLLFTIAIPVYKTFYLKECIESILCQTYPYFELIILNDASPYDIDGIISNYNDNRILYINNECNVGAINVVNNWNKCLSYAKGDYIICIGDDDRLLPNCLEEYVKLIERHPGIGLLHGWTEIIDENTDVIELTTHRCEFESAVSLAWHRWYSYSLQFIGDFCYNVALLRETGGFYVLPCAWGSDDISAIIASQKNGVANTQNVVFQYRRNSNSISSAGYISNKLEAICLEENWYKSFLSVDPDNDNDIHYIEQMRTDSRSHFEKKKGIILAECLRKSKSTFIRIVIHHNAYNLTLRSVMFAIVQASK